MKVCTVCRKAKEFWCFNRDVSRPDDLYPQCRICQNKKKRESNKRNPEKLRVRQRRASLKRKFGLTFEQYQMMLDSQDGVCAICGNTCATGKQLAVDHDRDCCPGEVTCGACIRGLLCYRCNTHLAWLEENYLETLEYIAEA